MIYPMTVELVYVLILLLVYDFIQHCVYNYGFSHLVNEAVHSFEQLILTSCYWLAEIAMLYEE